MSGNEVFENSAQHQNSLAKFSGKPRRVDKSHLKCDHFGKKGHLKTGCFKLVGFPEWWPGARDSKPRPRAMASNMMHRFKGNFEIPLDDSMMRMNVADGNGGHGEQSHTLNIAHYQNFAGSVFVESVFSASLNEFGSWIVDSGATTHMCNSIFSFDSYKPIKQPILVYLPNSSVCYVRNVGTIRINFTINLLDCLHLPSFKFNLLSVSKLSKQCGVIVNFSFTHCVFQDSRSYKVVGVGNEANGLYIIDSSFFSTKEL
ncbi:hypothetical protein LIER_36119 [Lithospermum erythrorhizon]|uniref:Retrovirus-related Pol polyprotein from transposon TNT 1-94-like beta-barrel domain-containing protein n=1 Tax=Lithospermum erythrorhizon TaxID=34254 RepID=A0AAV3P3S2_LITER